MVLQTIGVLYCPEEGCNHILAIGGSAIEGIGIAHSFKKLGKTVEHTGCKKIVLKVERDPIDHADVNDWHTFIQSKVDEIEGKK